MYVSQAQKSGLHQVRMSKLPRTKRQALSVRAFARENPLTDFYKIECVVRIFQGLIDRWQPFRCAIGLGLLLSHSVRAMQASNPGYRPILSFYQGWQWVAGPSLSEPDGEPCMAAGLVSEHFGVPGKQESGVYVLESHSPIRASNIHLRKLFEIVVSQ